MIIIMMHIFIYIYRFLLKLCHPYIFIYINYRLLSVLLHQHPAALPSSRTVSWFNFAVVPLVLAILVEVETNVLGEDQYMPNTMRLGGQSGSRVHHEFCGTMGIVAGIYAVTTLMPRNAFFGGVAWYIVVHSIYPKQY